MKRKNITRDEFIDLLSVAANPVRRRVSPGEAQRIAASLESNKSEYERAQGKPDPDGITKETGMRMISAAARAAEKRQKKRRE